MSAVKKYHQTSPDRANELFAKLLETSDTAVKTRERLFADLKQELELLANLHEQYLFPALLKHKETRDLVEEAMNDNKETEALLAELDRAPKNTGVFVNKLADLRKVFQQHIRDDKNELLPAVLKVLSEEEVDAVVEQVEDEMATVNDSKRSESELGRAVARRQREQAETIQRTAEGLAETVRTGAEGIHHMTRAAQDTVYSGFGTASELAQISTDRMAHLCGFPSQSGQDMAEQLSDNLQAIARSSAVLSRCIQDVSREWMGLSQERWQTNIEGLNALAACRTMSDVVAVQSTLVRRNLEQMFENSRRIAEFSFCLTEGTAQTMMDQAGRTADRARRST
ncbi:phasin family protein [Microvirga sp. 2TAF3]|uniref:phasin family protein n=1 Tax=Microvirga sp. 2TAF3 TaxID=3233014 RepID=UPI003F9C2341